MSLVPVFPKINRLGFHYFEDSQHYTNSDLEFWSAELKELGANWLVLSAPIERAIPEEFLKSLIEIEIQPILHFNPRIEAPLDKTTLRLLLNQYSRWGVRYVLFYDRPNLRTSWSPSTWSQVDLVDRFLDKFIPCAEMAAELSMTPIFPGLEPGGDYWDLAFLRSTFSSILRRGNGDLLEKLVLGAFARLVNRPVDWGAGGPQRWPDARPYRIQPGVQDHQGFHIYEWYLAAANQLLGRFLPILLLEAGYFLGDRGQTNENNESIFAINTLALLNRMAGEGEIKSQPVLPDSAVACCFPLVPGHTRGFLAKMSWYRSDGSPRPVVDAAKRWVGGMQSPPAAASQPKYMEDTQDSFPSIEPALSPNSSDAPTRIETDQPLISHYILLPLYAWGAADWDFELISPLLRDSHPTVGFSLNEASRAERVTVVGGPGVFTDEALALLRSSGCTIDRLTENGTVIAS
ncbi:MAG: hypothetical protein A2Z16_04315 [Chloroflexi bacterium RBG_16_54_18]|nr:MAG: hypothetical protein A2Z16_04315 [Chloroflexi bacterium RBG_16_54_18]